MFVVLYRWRIQQGKEHEFRTAWLSATRKIVARYGALGSRLHLADDGSWLAYAQWPDKERWLTMRSGPPAAPAEFAIMNGVGEASDPFPIPFLTMVLTDDATGSVS